MSTKKRTTKKRKPLDGEDDNNDLCDFVVSDEDYEEQTKYNKKKHNLSQIQKKQLEKLEKIKKEKAITLSKILNSNFLNDDKLWFIEYLKILENLDEGTEEKLRLTHMLEEKYNKLIESQQHTELIINLKKINNTDKKILDKIANSKQNDYVKSLLYKRYEKYQKDPENLNSEEYYKDIKWIENVLEIPTNIKTVNQDTNLSEQLILLKECLDNEVYGLDKVKEAVIEAFCAMKSDSEYQKKFIALVGPPGVGKTAIAKAISNAMGIPFGHIDFCTLKDPNVLVGHSQTYIGATPGMFVTLLKETQCLNPLILLDEIDKIPDEVTTIHSTLLQILDKTRNYRFTDAFTPEIRIDLSKVFFIVALNDETKVNGVLKDRLNIINIKGYSGKEKNIIGQKYILPTVMKNLGFADKDLICGEKSMDYLIDLVSNQESGVRELEKNITSLCEKINVLKGISRSNKKIKMSYTIPNLKFPFEITTDIVDLLMK
jgi:ATP-dependent Lon protease